MKCTIVKEKDGYFEDNITIIQILLKFLCFFFLQKYFIFKIIFKTNISTFMPKKNDPSLCETSVYREKFLTGYHETWSLTLTS